jgi:hypothetical protein
MSSSPASRIQRVLIDVIRLAFPGPAEANVGSRTKVGDVKGLTTDALEAPVS